MDDLDLVIKTLEEAGFSHDRFYIHCDGALFGLMMPFVKRVSIECYQKTLNFLVIPQNVKLFIYYLSAFSYRNFMLPNVLLFSLSVKMIWPWKFFSNA